MFDLIGSIKKKTGLDDLFGDGMSVPKSVQDVIKIDAVYSDGIFLTGKDRYSKTFKFTDINGQPLAYNPGNTWVCIVSKNVANNITIQ